MRVAVRLTLCLRSHLQHEGKGGAQQRGTQRCKLLCFLPPLQTTPSCSSTTTAGGCASCWLLRCHGVAWCLLNSQQASPRNRLARNRRAPAPEASAHIHPCVLPSPCCAPSNNVQVSVMEDEGSLADHLSGVGSTDGRWHHVAVTWRSSDGQVKLYDNGREVGGPWGAGACVCVSVCCCAVGVGM